MNKNYFIARLNQFLLSYFTKSYITKTIKQEQPDKIIIFHFFLVQPVLAALNKL
ncbi:MAG: hypothetical protein WCJ39_00610 [bacterium]